MEGKFVLTIELGNAAMQTSEDIATALYEVARGLDRQGQYYPHGILDENGNTVGKWEVTD